MRYRVTEARTIEGYELKASFVYAAGDTVEDGVTPADHVARLAAAGVLEGLPAAPAEPPGAPAGAPLALSSPKATRRG